MLIRLTIFYLLFTCILQQGDAKEPTDIFRIHSDFPTINKDKDLLLDVDYFSDSAINAFLQVQYFLYLKTGDSILVLNKQNYKVASKKGVGKTRMNFSNTDSTTSYSPKFYEILKRTNSAPPGSYKIFYTVKHGGEIFRSVYFREIDSILSPNSPVRKDINKSLLPKQKSFLGLRFNSGLDNLNSSASGRALSNARNKVDKAAKKRGLTTVHNEINGKAYVDLYYDDWFAGRYEANNKGPLNGKIKPETPNMSANNSVSNTNLDHPSLFSQYKSQNKQKKDQDDIKGEIALTTNVSNGQEQYSAVDNNYYELRGRVELPIGCVPVQMEGLYTSQDNHNEIKSSYFKVHYDVEKMKEDLQKSTNSYNGKFQETKSRGLGMNQIYSSAISNLEKQKSTLQNEINVETTPKTTTGSSQLKDDKLKNDLAKGLEKQSKDTSGFSQIVVNKPDSSQQDSTKVAEKKTPNPSSEASASEAKVKNETTEQEKRIEAKKKMIEAIDRKIEKYKTLLAQNKNTSYFDSTMAYNKTKDIGNQSDMTYRQMAKRSESLLPDGQAKGFLSSVTTMDAGMFNKTESQYTMAGQQMKGLDFGYDLGLCETGLTLGKTQYIGRDGSLDKYTFYSGKASFKPMKTHKISLIYYGYSPDQKMISGDGFFKNANISAPGFFEPVHIISTKYDGSISKYVKIGAESAISLKNSNQADDPVITSADKMAYHFNLDGNIPNTAINLQGNYDKTGKGFENNTLPVTLEGTEQYKLSAKDIFFHSYLSLGIEYDLLIQNNFNSGSKSTKWGFDAKTNSKRYPNVAFSYKPFTTFHSYTDTLNVPQRPLIGSVWTGKASYQIKRQQKSLRFLILFSKNTSTMDTSNYGSNLLQVSCIYTDKILTSSVSMGTMQVTGTNSSAMATSPNNTRFLSLGMSYILNKHFSITGGQDLGLADFGFCKYAINGGIMYHPEKKPFTLRVSTRFNTYELNAGQNWNQLYSGNIDLAYKFKAKSSKMGSF